jgi:hypothetical protein
MEPDRLSKAGTRNLSIMPFFVAFLAFFYWALRFSGPYRWLADLQMLAIGTYSEWVSAPVLAVILLVLAGAVSSWIVKTSRGISYGTSEGFVLLTLAALSAFGLMFAWDTAQAYWGMPSADDPVEVIDLDRVDPSELRSGHVRLVGRLDSEREVEIWRSSRRWFDGYTEVYVPVVGLRSAFSAGPVLVVTDHAPSPDGTGYLIANGLETRIRYEILRAGVPLVREPFLLTGRSRDMELQITVSVLMVAMMLIMWPMILYKWLSGEFAEERARIAEGAGAMPPPPAAPVVEQSLPVGGGKAFSAASASVVGFPAPPAGMGLLCVLRDAKVHGQSYQRINVDGARAAVLKPRQYVCIPLIPGEHEVATNVRVSLVPSKRIRVSIGAGEVLVYRIKMPFIGVPYLEPLEEIVSLTGTLGALKRVQPN